MTRGLSCRRDEVRGIKIILAGNPDQGEEGIAARISQRRVRCGVAVSAMAQTGQSEAIHSPEAWARTVVKFTACRLVDGGGLDRGDLVLAQGFAHDTEPARQRRIAK
jgi:hypothetical protein